ncbi:MAG TPA: DUF3141 domain-containing protein [Paenalcaligenes sp.]|nr:DUF3141 domain-containing protein [Paenalcaligenes sp.]
MSANFLQQFTEYWLDAQQRSALFLDILRQRGDQFIEHTQAGKPPVLVFEHECVLDGRTLEQPVNYSLLRIIPSKDHPVDPDAKPFVIIDPRAGHGPGVAGSKLCSEIGVVAAAGHPCYFVTFGPEPCEGQTIEAVVKAEMIFLQKVAQLHDPKRVGKPFIIGNCQGGWAAALLASVAPDLAGPLLLAGAPLAYWSGRAGQNPMRYTAGVVGGSWPSSFVSDLQGGIFDGAYLVENFEQLDPANTYWKKLYNLYANADTETERFLQFERWWNGHFLLTRQEIDWIVQNLFVGNQLSRGRLHNPVGDGYVNLRNIRSPIIVFASEGDNITPPPQALNWILDLYQDVEDIREHEQVIVYCLHEKIGHLGIFVSSSVASREHEALVGALDLIGLLPPGLYEAKIEDLHPHMPHTQWIKGRHLVTFVPRTLDDIRALDDGRSDEHGFEVVNRISVINQHIYDFAISPVVRALSTGFNPQWMRALHPNRMENYLWSSLNPMALYTQMAARNAKQERVSIAEDNIFLAWERLMGNALVNGLNAYRDIRDQTIEATFHALYDNPYARALVGLDAPSETQKVAQSDDSALHSELRELRRELAALEIDQGGTAEAFARVLIYMAGERTFIDERAFNMLHNLASHARHQLHLPSQEELRPIMRRQWRIVRAYPEQAIEALPLLVQDHAARQSIWAAVSKIAELRDVLNVDAGVHERFDHVARVMGLTSQWSPGVRESHINPEAVQLPRPVRRPTKAAQAGEPSPAAAHTTATTRAPKAAKKAAKKEAIKKTAKKAVKKAAKKAAKKSTAQGAKKTVTQAAKKTAPQAAKKGAQKEAAKMAKKAGTKATKKAAKKST